MSDRIKIMRKAQWPEINISPQVLLSCEKKDLGCHGGDSLTAFEWIHQNEITDETCSIYRARGHENGLDCAPDVMCKNCGKECFVPDEYPIYKVTEYGHLSGEKAMMNEIY
jgi:cathepsin X